ncbi:hypothetical protein J7F01_26895 [Streptomyces sp. ISL-22]|uniref:hypothetical protein n=1 Tax=Streptomyces TaxID=1883 RepID=UPI000A62C610|nr:MULTISPECIES: hypothetical protein [Streptomyces]MBT2423825.1 hypothetical protein [Streptomyces sp. ISL-24]MBT2435730.1 hypothetical protein [Streptomyces sp. ISL-22]
MNRVRAFSAIVAPSALLALGSIVLATPAQAAVPPSPKLASVGGIDAVRGVGSIVNTLPPVGVDAKALTGNGVGSLPKVRVDPKGLTNPAGSVPPDGGVNAVKGVGNTVGSLGGTVGGVGGILGGGKPS